MGVLCTRNKEQEEISDAPYYEILCQNIEKRLIFSKLNIKELEAEIYSIEKSQGSFTSEDVIKVHERHGVTRKEFLRENGVCLDLLPDYRDCELCGQYLLTTALPFCAGAIGDKKDILWHLLEPQKQGVEQKVLKNVIRMVIVLSVKTIPEIVLRDVETRGDVVEDKDMVMLLESDDKTLKEYVKNYYWEFLKQIQEENRGPDSSSSFVSRYEYDLWMLKINEDKLLSSSGNREVFLDYIKNRPVEENGMEEAT